jgi:hypothetical protein
MLENDVSLMLISREKSLFKKVSTHKTSKGLFLTRKALWLTSQIEEFITRALHDGGALIDPFAGEGHLLSVCQQKFNCSVLGYDVVPGKWSINDSLLSIPIHNNGVIVTNPPYLAKHSAKRKGVYNSVSAYFEKFDFDDLYQLALYQCIKAARYTVAIIPETFLNSDFPKCQLDRVVILENNPFEDTENPVCVACFDSQSQKGQGKIYVGEEYCGTYADIFRHRQSTSRSNRIIFNDPKGNLALRAVDSTDPKSRMGFAPANGFDYSRENIKVSSRLLTYISIKGITDSSMQELIRAANEKLEALRSVTFDLIFSPFKGNNKIGKRRRRLDYELARFLLSSALADIENQRELNV